MANINKSKKYHYLYKTTDLRNGAFYIGVHSTSNMDDGYLGSGTRLRRAIRKHGKENFRLEILEFFDSREVLMQRERELVNEFLLTDPMCMNLKPGGSGGFCSDEHKRKFIAAALVSGASEKGHEKLALLRTNPEWVKQLGNNIKKAKQKNPKPQGTFKGKTHTDETKRKISNALKGRPALNKGT